MKDIDNIIKTGEMELKLIEIIKKIGNELYLKYVKVGSEYEINISSSLRNKFYNYFENNRRGSILINRANNSNNSDNSDMDIISKQI